MDVETELTPDYGITYQETTETEESRFIPIRHFGVPPDTGDQSEQPLGPLALISFICPSRADQLSSNNGVFPSHNGNGVLTPHNGNNEDKLRDLFESGFFLHSKEKGVAFPLIHFNDDRESLKKRLSDEHVLDNDCTLSQGVYREVRSIRPEGVDTNGHFKDPKDTVYILLGFKSMDKHFSQEVMVNSWKEWTGARDIYMNLDDELGLTRISFYQREAPHSVSMFLYLVLAECTSVSTLDHQVKLQDFVQRLRAERMPGFVSVYRIASSQ